MVQKKKITQTSEKLKGGEPSDFNKILTTQLAKYQLQELIFLLDLFIFVRREVSNKITGSYCL